MVVFGQWGGSLNGIWQEMVKMRPLWRSLEPLSLCLVFVFILMGNHVRASVVLFTKDAHAPCTWWEKWMAYSNFTLLFTFIFFYSLPHPFLFLSAFLFAFFFYLLSRLRFSPLLDHSLEVTPEVTWADDVTDDLLPRLLWLVFISFPRTNLRAYPELFHFSWSSLPWNIK